MKHIKVPIRRLTKLSTRRIMMNKASKARRLMTLCMSLLLVIAGSAITAPTASANDVTATVFDTPDVRYVNVRDGAGPEYNWIGQIDAGQTVTLECFDWMYGGDDIKGPYSSSRIWYKIKGYDNGWVSDAYLNTGSNDPVTPQCDIPWPVSGQDLNAAPGFTHWALLGHYGGNSGQDVKLPWNFFGSPGGDFVREAYKHPIGDTWSYQSDFFKNGPDVFLSMGKFNVVRTSPNCFRISDTYDYDWGDWSDVRALPDNTVSAFLNSAAQIGAAKEFHIYSSGCYPEGSGGL